MKNEHQAKAIGRNLPISFKYAIEIGSFIRGKTLKQAKLLLEQVIAKKRAVPMKRFNRDVGHKRGRIAAGRYPVKASSEVLALIHSAEMNALNKGLSSENLMLTEYIANKGATQWRFGRQRRRKAKRTHIIVILEEAETSKPKEFAKKQDAKSGNKNNTVKTKEVKKKTKGETE